MSLGAEDGSIGFVAGCVGCQEGATLGLLCRDHAAAIATCVELAREDIIGRAVPGAELHLIDAWGRAHSLYDGATIGSGPRASVFIKHHSICDEHAQFERVSEGWRVCGHPFGGSVRVNAEDVLESAPVGDGDRVTFGSVTFWFCDAAVASRAWAMSSASFPEPDPVDFAARLSRGDCDLVLHKRERGGVCRNGDANPLRFANLEFSLLQVLSSRKLNASDPDRAFVSTPELAATLEFRSRQADGENVRELVRRVRKKLKAAGVPDLIESRQGVGYRLAWDVETLKA